MVTLNENVEKQSQNAPFVHSLPTKICFSAKSGQNTFSILLLTLNFALAYLLVICMMPSVFGRTHIYTCTYVINNAG